MLETTNGNWHNVPIHEVLSRLDSHLDQGLSAEEAAKRLQRHGPNDLSRKQQSGPLKRFVLQIHQPLLYILLGSSVTTLCLGKWIDAFVIFAVVLINAIVGFIQEGNALRAIDSLGKTLVTEATLVRNGEKIRIASSLIVPGDVVLLQSGDKVPADLRLFRCKDLQVSEASLTGESLPVEKGIRDLDADTSLADRVNMAYGSTLVTYGQAAGLVVETGDRTEVGRISQLIASVQDLQTPLTKSLDRFSNVLLVLILVFAGLSIVLELARGRDLVDSFLAAVAMAVAAIPEGLPAAITIMLAIGVTRMAKRRAIIRKLPAVETLGSTTVICSDKTGTLTQNEMTVTRAFAGGQHYCVQGVGYNIAGSFRRTESNDSISTTDLASNQAMTQCLRAGVLCNDSQLVRANETWSVQGDPTEGALIVSAAKADLHAFPLSEQYPRLDSIPFESEHQYMATLHADREKGSPTAYAKGSIEAILKRCQNSLSSNGYLEKLNHDSIYGEVERLAASGLRVLAFAQKTIPSTSDTIRHADLESGMTFLGLQAMLDPPRPEVIQSIARCHQAGIHIKMITGDHAKTASAIAQQLGIDGSITETPRALTGHEIESMNDEELTQRVEGISVFARVSPEHKLRIVKSLQRLNHVVAMTGDGVNDAPALKQSDIGIAMGRGGTDVAREASDMVLTDDNFASIEAAVEEGRGVFDNLTKFIVWTLPTNVGEGMVILAAVLLGTALPIAPVQILWINMTTAILLGLMLAFEPHESSVMARPPRAPSSSFLNQKLLKRVGFVSILLLLGSFGVFEWMQRYRDASYAEAQTAAANVFVIGQLAYLFNCRSLTKNCFRIGVFSNMAAIYGSIGMLVLQVAFTHAPLLNRLFHTAPHSLEVWGWIGLIGVAIFFIVEVEKHLVGHTLQGATFDSAYRDSES
jgi:cation-transporting P-type ATPase F